MKVDLPVQCECGAFRGVASGLTPRNVTRVVCHCSDCQAFAHYLDRPERVLDGHGGTEICQVSPSRVRFEVGADRLACVRVTAKGPYRWYTTCCRSPVANTMPGVPVAGLVCPTVEPNDAELGSIKARIFGRDATGDSTTLDAADGVPLPMFLPLIGKLLFRRIRGDHRQSPFHDEKAGRAAAPTTLTDEERRAIDARRINRSGPSR